MHPPLNTKYAVTKLIFYFMQYVNEHQFGMVFTAPIEVHLSETTRPIQPDVIVVTREQQPQAGASFIDGPPTLVVEVVSPTSIRRDRHTKFDVYEQSGMQEYWIVDPRTRSVEVWTLSSGEYALVGQFVGADLLQSQLLEELSIPTNTLFLP